ncbi:hypothetical protein [Streptomyces sp. CA-111067]|uniref:hypothetical protein n=1 Tax=Streptomyces sp. CA-111067 TaxID=3240046 RepID=UPI003D973CFD
MDLVGVGAIAAAATTAVGIPAAILVGRWQMRAGLRSAEAGMAQAEATGRAAIAEAEATYRATLDAVRAQASAEHSQWLRGVRRDAYVAFLLAVQGVNASAEKLATPTNAASVDTDTVERINNFEKSLTALNSALLVVSLEGPFDVKISADYLAGATFTIARKKRRDAEAEWVWTRLERTGVVFGRHGTLAHDDLDVEDALERLRRAKERIIVTRATRAPMPPPQSVLDEFRGAVGLAAAYLSEDMVTALLYYANGDPDYIGQVVREAERDIAATTRRFFERAEEALAATD